jgi:hypothetical protein
VRIDPERAQVPGKASILGKLSAWSTNFFNNFAAKTTRIARARMDNILGIIKPIPRAGRARSTQGGKFFFLDNPIPFFFQAFFFVVDPDRALR